MSGGHFDYNQYIIQNIADEIENVVKNNNVKNEYDYSRNYSKETIKEFNEAITLLRKASIYSQRIDWLLSDDDGEETFHERLEEDLKELNDS